MGVDSKHGEYTKAISQWKRIRDCYEGQDAVHDAGETYLPKLSGQSDSEYKAYVKRAMFYGATSRTIDSLTGMVFRKQAEVELSPSVETYADDITLAGLSLHGFAEEIVDEVVKVARCGILVDFPSVISTQDAPITVAVAERENIRPFLKAYKAEAIINWKTQLINNATTLTEVRLAESVAEPDGEFDVNIVEQIRVLSLDPLTKVYTQRVFRKNAKQEWVQYGDTIVPRIKNATLNYIPFIFVGAKNSMPNVEKPLLIDLANVNISHYITTADLEHGAHFTALPTAVIVGAVATDEDADLDYKIGSANAWVFPSADTKAFFLEFQGQGLDSLSKRLTQKEEYMAFLGAKMLAPDKRGVEATDTALLYRQGENSVLASLAKSASAAIQKALNIMAEWAGDTAECVFVLNTDFLPASMSPQEIEALMKLWQSGGIAFDDLLENLKRGEIVRSERTSEDINAENEMNNPFTKQMEADLNAV